MLVVDIESSGLDPTRHGILSIGAVDFEQPERIFYGECRLDQGKIADPAALEYNGFTTEQINDSSKPSQNELIKKFAQWAYRASQYTIAGQNPAGLDYGMLTVAFKDAGLDWKFGFRTIDLHSIAFFHHKQTGKKLPIVDKASSLDLDAILQYVGLDAEPEPHHGLTGARLEAEAFSRLLYGRSLLKEYGAFPIPNYLQKK